MSTHSSSAANRYSRTYIRAALALLVIGALYAAAWYRDAHTPYHEAEAIGRGVVSFSQLSDRFVALAKEKGAVYAFAVLGRANLPPNTDLHLLGHAIGDILYKQQGVGGIAYCTQDFRNACSHSIVIGALQEYGEGALPKIHVACLKAPGGSGAYTMCYHGLGHGIFAYFRYDLAKTVALCKKTGTEAYHDQEFSECVGGAIMELISGGGHDHDDWIVANRTYLDPKDPLSPCMSSVIPEEAKVLCLSYLTPELFVRAGTDLGNPSPNLFPKAFSYCNAIPTSQQKLRDACYGGFGKEFVPLAAARDIRTIDQLSDAQYQTAISWCKEASDRRGIAQCIINGVASIFWGGENNPDGAFRFCSLADTWQDECYAGLEIEIVHYSSTDKRSELCARLPATLQAGCLQGTEVKL